MQSYTSNASLFQQNLIGYLQKISRPQNVYRKFKFKHIYKKWENVKTFAENSAASYKNDPVSLADNIPVFLDFNGKCLQACWLVPPLLSVF